MKVETSIKELVEQYLKDNLRVELVVERERGDNSEKSLRLQVLLKLGSTSYYGGEHTISSSIETVLLT